MPDPALPPAQIDLATMFQRAKATFRITLARCLGRGLLAMLCSGLPSLYLMARGAKFDLLNPPTDPAFWVLTAAGVVGYQLAAAMLLRCQAQVMGGLAQGVAPARGTLAADLAAAARALPTLLLGALIGALAVSLVVGTAQAATRAPLLVVGAVPAIWLFITLLPLRAVAMVEGAGPLVALRRCAHLVRGRWARFLAAGLIAAMVLVVCVLAAGIVLELARQGLVAAGAPEPAVTALVAAATLAVEATAVVYLNAVWLALHGAATAGEGTAA